MMLVKALSRTIIKSYQVYPDPLIMNFTSRKTYSLHSDWSFTNRSLFSTLRQMSNNQAEYLQQLRTMAQSHLDKRQFALARDTLRKTADLIKQYFGEDHIMYAQVLKDIGHAYANDGKHNEAINYFKKSKNSINGTQENEAYLNGQIGKAYYHLNKIDLAYKYLNDSLHNISQQANFEYLASLHEYFGTAQKQRNNIEEAIKAYTYAVQLYQTKQGFIPSSSIFVLKQLGDCYYLLKRDSQSLVVYQKLYQYAQKEEQQSTTGLQALTMIGLAHHKIGNHEQFVRYFEKCVSIIQKWAGKECNMLALYLKRLGSALFQKESYEQSIQYLQRLTKICQKSLQDIEETTYYISAVIMIGRAHKQLADYLLALEFYQKALELLECYRPDDKDLVAYVYGLMGEALLQRGNFKQSSGFIKKAIQYYKDSGHKEFEYAYTNTMRVIQMEIRKQQYMELKSQERIKKDDMNQR